MRSYQTMFISMANWLCENCSILPSFATGMLCEIDWVHLIRRFKDWNAQTALSCHFLAGNDLLGIPIPREFRVNSLASLLHASGGVAD